VQLDDKQIHMQVSQAAREWFAKRGYDADMGARPMARLIQQELMKTDGGDTTLWRTS